MALTLVAAAPALAQVVVGGPGYPYPYPYRYRYAAPDASVRFDVKPHETAVYVDGYYAGIVDDFDGAFQRLRTAPGGHEITLYFEGYRTYNERVYLSPDTTFKFRHRMEPLAAGQVAERPPQPAPPPQFEGQPGQPGEGEAPPPPARGPYGRRGAPPNYPPNAPPPRGAPQPPEVDGRSGTLSLAVQPGDAEVLVDGMPWRGPSQDRLMIELSEGRHNIQIRKSGFVGYLTDVQIRRGETTELDVQLKTQPR
jgi:PEGA domain